MREKSDEGSRKNGGDQDERRRRPHAAVGRRGHQIVAGVRRVGQKVVQRSCGVRTRRKSGVHSSDSPWPGLAEISTARERIIARALLANAVAAARGYFCSSPMRCEDANTNTTPDRTRTHHRLGFAINLSCRMPHKSSAAAIRGATAGHTVAEFLLIGLSL